MAHDLAEFIIKSIVSQPEAVVISEDMRGSKCTLRIRVAQKDMARVMGSRGLVVRAIRTLVLGASDVVDELVIEPMSDNNGDDTLV